MNGRSTTARPYPHADPRTDRARLTGVAYATSGALRQRIALYDHQIDPLDLPAWVLDQLSVPPRATVVDVGCGPGRYLALVRARDPGATAIGLDLSRGMASEAAPHGVTGVADAIALPLRDACVGALVAAHMLYHVGDIDAALGEFARVLAPDGAAAIVLNGDDHLPEMYELLRAAFEAVAGSAHAAALGERTFQRATLRDAAPRVGRWFASVECVEARRAIEVPEPEPVVRYVDSLRSLYPEPPVPWDALLASAATIVTATIAREGAFRTHSHVGVLIAGAPRAAR